MGESENNAQILGDIAGCGDCMRILYRGGGIFWYDKEVIKDVVTLGDIAWLLR